MPDLDPDDPCCRRCGKRASETSTGVLGGEEYGRPYCHDPATGGLTCLEQATGMLIPFDGAAREVMGEPTPKRPSFKEWLEQGGSLAGWRPLVEEPAVARCDGCGRSTWACEDVGKVDTMTQPNGKPCGGIFRAPSRVTAAQLARHLALYTFTFTRETEFHAGLTQALTELHVPFHAEVPLTAADRIDFLVDTVGVEVKVKGSTADVFRQLQRYSHSPQVTELILVTTVPAHLQLPGGAGTKPLHVHLVQAGGLL